MNQSPEPPHQARFGMFEFDFHTRELRKNGMKVKLNGQPVEVLATLLERPNELVTREKLQKRLWPGDTIVEFDYGINAAVKRVREALGDSADNPRFVETLHRRGYRFIGPVETVAAIYDRRPSGAADASSPVSGRASAARRYSRRPVALAGGALVAIAAILLALNVGGLRDRFFPQPPPKIQSIAVLPLENLSGDPGQEYFADGMTKALIAHLGKIRALKVISRTSVMRFKGARPKGGIREIAQQLNVDAVLEGSVTRAGDRVRITAQLIEAGSERLLWVESYDRDLRDVLALQSEVAEAVAREIRITVRPQ